MQLWLRTKAYFVKANTDDPVSPEEERAFLDIKSEIQRLQRILRGKLIANITFGAEKMQDLLKQSISIKHLRELPRADRQGLLNAWHFVFIHLGRATGALQFIAEGYVPPQRAKTGSGGNISDLKKGAAKTAPKEKPPIVKIIVVLVLLIVAVVVLGKRLNMF